jgi:azurin
MKRQLRSLGLVLFCAMTVFVSAADKLDLKAGDHIAIIGNTLADRMQHSGYFEALVHKQFPQHALVFRNLGYAADEVVTRPRSENFGTPSDWLTRVQAGVVFAFFGFNESFKGEAGMWAFRSNLVEFISATRKADYSGKGAPRLVLFSPIAAEKHTDPNFPNPDPINRQLEPYVKLMSEVARTNGVQFVDLFAASKEAYADTRQSLTVNGIHLSDEGYKAIATAMFTAVFGTKAPSMRGAAFEKLVTAVNEKNAVWFSRYRTVDGYNVYGGRSALAYAPNKSAYITDRNAPEPHVSNYKVMQQEMSQRDVMTANRDARVWAVAKGGDLAVTDSNLPAVQEVKSNKPGTNPDGSHPFLSGADALKHLKVPPGCKIEFIASEKEFPELVKPVQMAFDTKGRLWVAAWKNYPERTPTSKDGDKLLVFDLNADGSVKKMTVFLDDLNCPTGFQFYKDGVLVVQAPDVWFVRDTNGDGKADSKVRMLNGMDSADSHHTANAICYEPGGAIYLSDGTFHRTSVETAVGPVRNVNGAIYRYEPRTGKFIRHVPYGFANPHGRVFDYWGNDFITDATGNANYFGPAFSGFLESGSHPGMNTYWKNPSRPCPGTAMLSSRHFPESMQGEFLNINVIGFQGIYRVKNTAEGSGILGTTMAPPMLENDNAANPNFRPIAADVAPDGSLYVLDWANSIIGHMQHHLRDPNRDQIHGRIYRITYPERPLLVPKKIDGESIANLIELLKEPEDNVRTRAKIELDKHDSAKVLAAAMKWAKQFDPKSVTDAHHLLEVLWLHQWHNVVNEPLLKQLLASPESRARAQAVRVLGYWGDRVSQPLALLKVAANDPAPRVRLEAARVASFFTGDEAMEVAYQVTKHPMDYYLEYVFKETTRQLSKSAKNFSPKDPALLSAAVNRMTDQELAAAPASEPVLLARLERKTSDVNTRNAALDALAKLRKTDRTAEAVAALQRLDTPDAPLQTVNDLALLLTAMPDGLAKSRVELQRLTTDTHQPAVRRAASAALVALDGKPEPAWETTAGNPGARVLLIDSIVMLADPNARTAFQPLLATAVSDAKSDATVRTAALRALPLMGTDFAAKNFSLIATRLATGQDVTASARAIRKLPRETWAKEQAAPLTDAIVKWAGAVPAGKRTEQEFVETVQVGMDLATLLPAADSARVRSALLDVSVSVFVVKTVREQMRYDVGRIVVEAGKAFEIIFENDDMMPHNLVVTVPGAREEIGTLADKMQPTALDRQGRAFIPSGRNVANKILGATKLVDPGQKETLKLVAPNRPGTNEFVCTFPEHWKVMFGQLVVVKDKAALLEASAAPAPQQAAAAHNH